MYYARARDTHETQRRYTMATYNYRFSSNLYLFHPQTLIAPTCRRPETKFPETCPQTPLVGKSRYCQSNSLDLGGTVPVSEAWVTPSSSDPPPPVIDAKDQMTPAVLEWPPLSTSWDADVKLSVWSVLLERDPRLLFSVTMRFKYEEQWILVIWRSLMLSRIIYGTATIRLDWIAKTWSNLRRKCQNNCKFKFDDGILYYWKKTDTSLMLYDSSLSSMAVFHMSFRCRLRTSTDWPS